MGMKSSVRRARLCQLVKMWKTCFWCDLEVEVCLVYDGILPEWAATIDHIYPKTDQRRTMPGGEAAQVLACFGCNKQRNEYEQAVRAGRKYKAKIRVKSELRELFLYKPTEDIARSAALPSGAASLTDSNDPTEVV